MTITKQTIARDNDHFRTTLFKSPRHRIVLSEAVADLKEQDDPEPFQNLILSVISFNPSEHEDAHGEHDFGAVTVGKTDYFWKIDYFDDNYENGADPLEGPVCRVLTIMESAEY